MTHEGRHQWPSEEIAYKAVEWFELQAMKRGDTVVDKDFVRDLYDASMDEAKEMQRSHDEASAFRRYREIVADFEQFGIAGNAEEAKDKDYQVSGTAFRMLASSFANTGFYEPRDYLREGDFERAAGVLRIAQEILPDFPRTCYQLAQATAQLGRVDEAIEALTCAVDAGWATHGHQQLLSAN